MPTLQLHGKMGEETVNGYFDSELISVVIRNLVSNAIKFTPHHGKIVIRANRDEDQNKLIIEVSDSGKGMSHEIIENLMNKNIHFTTYGTDNEKGSGLGFQLCKEFVALNNGSITIESIPDKGSIFSIFLPLDASPIDSSDQKL